MAYAMGGARLDDERPQGVVVPGADWGPYTAAVERWSAVTGRPAPSPVRNDGKGGKPRLNPELPEWMMGWPAGWVTDPAIGLTRAEQLKAAGNGVVPQQAAAALRMLLARPGVPPLQSATTPTGIPVTGCAECGRSHPETRDHCELCGHASLFLNDSRLCVPCAAVAS
jgi:DNA (cytosine-5)-methyltransferase 1